MEVHLRSLLSRGRLLTSLSSTVSPVNVTRRSPKARKLRFDRNELLRQNRRSPALEQAVRAGTLLVPLHEVQSQEPQRNAAVRLQTAGIHFNIFDDVYGSLFLPHGCVKVTYKEGSMVHHGNIIKPAQAAEAPEVHLPIDAPGNELWTLILTNPDGHLQDNSRELCHWMICDIPHQGPVAAGRELVPYLLPLPLRGTGVHRMVFSLYHHPDPLTFSSPASTSSWLEQRTFSTRQLLSHTPLHPFSFCFFQTFWDQTVKQAFSETLHVSEPVYDFEKPLTPRKIKQEQVRAVRASRFKFVKQQ